MLTSMFPPTSADKTQLTLTIYEKQQTITHTWDAMFVYFTWTRHNQAYRKEVRSQCTADGECGTQSDYVRIYTMHTARRLYGGRTVKLVFFKLFVLAHGIARDRIDLVPYTVHGLLQIQYQMLVRRITVDCRFDIIQALSAHQSSVYFGTVITLGNLFATGSRTMAFGYKQYGRPTLVTAEFSFLFTICQYLAKMLTNLVARTF